MAGRRRSADLSESGDGRKLAAKTAELLENEIIKAGWPVGTVMGSEAELLDRYQVSRAVLREAIRVLEHHDVAHMRRGPGGGLVVKAPDSAAAVRASALNLEYRGATFEQVFEARQALELRCVELAAERIDEPGIDRLRLALSAEQAAQEAGEIGTHDLHLVLAEMSGNPAFVLFIDVLTQLSVGGGQREQTTTVAIEVHHAHEQIAKAVMAGDSALARHHMRTHLIEIGAWVSQRPGAGQRPA